MITSVIDDDFGLVNVLRALQNNQDAVNSWILSFIQENRNPNDGLAQALARKQRIWVGPIPVALEHFERIAGPDRKFFEEEHRWNTRIKRIKEIFGDRPEQLPPSIALAAPVSAEDGTRSFALTLIDGAHRLEAMRGLGSSNFWAFVGFDDEVLRDKFLVEYARGNYLGGGTAAAKNDTPSPKETTAVPNDQLGSHYTGRAASTYDAARLQQPHWHTEQETVGRLLANHRGATVLDAPIGTGRFIPFYKELGCSVIGADISRDMLAEAQAKANDVGLTAIKLAEADATSTDFEEVDLAVCLRFINLIPPEKAERLIYNLGKAARKEMIIHLNSIDEEAMPEAARKRTFKAMDEAHERQRAGMAYAAHRWSSFLGWCGAVGFDLVESIETQASRGFAHVHVHRLSRRVK